MKLILIFILSFNYLIADNIIDQNVTISDFKGELTDINLHSLDDESITVVNFISDLRTLDPNLIDGKVVFVEHHSKISDIGGGFFSWETTSVIDHDSDGIIDDDGIIIETSQSSTGYWKRDGSQNYYNILWFGAKSSHLPGNITGEENRLAIQKAIYAAQSAGLQSLSTDGRVTSTVYFPAGKYPLTNFDASLTYNDTDGFEDYPTHAFGAVNEKAITLLGTKGITLKGDKAILYGEVSNDKYLTDAIFFDDSGSQNIIDGIEFIEFNEAISFDTSNLALAMFKVTNCSFIDCNLGITSRQYEIIDDEADNPGDISDGSRSTNFIIENVRMFNVKKILQSTTDLLLIQNCYFNQYRPKSNESHQPMMDINSGTTIINSMFIPAKNNEQNPNQFDNIPGAFWIDFNYAEDKQGRFLNVIGSRFGGENGGISIVKVSTQANSMNAVSPNFLQTSISFDTCMLNSLKGGFTKDDGVTNKGGVVCLSKVNGKTVTPNMISFVNCNNSIKGTGDENFLVVSEDSNLQTTLPDDFSFKIYVDEQSMRRYDRHWDKEEPNWHPVSKELLPYLNRQTRKHLKDRTQVLNGAEILNPSILRGSVLDLRVTHLNTVPESQKTVYDIHDAKTGDKVILVGNAGGPNVTIYDSQTPIPGTSSPTEYSNFILAQGISYKLEVNRTITFVKLPSGEWLETNRNWNTN